MKERVKINLDEKVLRLEVPTNNGLVVVNEPSQNLKKELINMLILCITENKDFDEKKIMLDLINDCTNADFDGDIFEVTNLSHEAQMITNEILIIFQEILSETYQMIKMAMQQAKNEMLQNEILKEKDEIIEKAEDIQNKKEEIDVKEVPHRTVKKMPRGKKK